MKKVLKWAGIFISTVGLGTLIMYGIPVLLMVLVLKGLEYEHAAMNDDAEAALKNIGLSAYTEYATWHDMSISGVMTVFELPKYDNHTDNTDLRAGVMAHADQSPDWRVESVTTDEYAAMLNTHLPEAAFLLPADVTFDARYQADNTMAFFDQDTGLMVYLRTDTQPHAGSTRADKLSVPHNGFVYETETHGGFLGDGTTLQALIVPEENRVALEETLSSHADWHEGTVTYEEYAVLQDRLFYEAPGLYPSADVDFEWWSYVDTFARQHPNDLDTRTRSHDYFPTSMQEAGAIASMNWLVALYDMETGLFIYYQYDS